MAGKLPVLDVVYSDAESFRREYESDLSNGGVFIPSECDLELRAHVTVKLQLCWCERDIEFEGEVVHVVPPEMGEVGAKPGVAVQFLVSAFEVRDQLAPLTFQPTTTQSVSASDTRSSVRKPARVATQIDWEGGRVLGCTRNLSRSGVLIGLQENEIPIGEVVTVTMQHPGTGRAFEVQGRVARQVSSENRVTALGIEFEADEDSRDNVDRFIDEVMGAEHTRRLGAISGPIAELGPHSIVQMLATSAQTGTIVLRRGEEEGVLCFENQLLVSVSLGAARGMKALVRLLTWRDGTFEFTSGTEGERMEDPMPLDAAILEAVRQIDEGERVDTVSFPLQARLVQTHNEVERFEDHSTVEEAILDLATAGFTVSRALEVVPESDLEIFRAIQQLIDTKELELH